MSHLAQFSRGPIGRAFVLAALFVAVSLPAMAVQQQCAYFNTVVNSNLAFTLEISASVSGSVGGPYSPSYPPYLPGETVGSVSAFGNATFSGGSPGFWVYMDRNGHGQMDSTTTLSFTPQGGGYGTSKDVTSGAGSFPNNLQSARGSVTLNGPYAPCSIGVSFTIWVMGTDTNTSVDSSGSTDTSTGPQMVSLGGSCQSIPMPATFSYAPISGSCSNSVQVGASGTYYGVWQIPEEIYFTITPTGSAAPRPPYNLQATQLGTDGSTIRLTWSYDNIASLNGFELHKTSPSGGVDYTIPVDLSACAGSPVSCTYDDGAITPYATYNYEVRAISSNGDSAYSTASAAFQLKTGHDGANLATIESDFTPDPNANSVSDVAKAIGYDHFNWIQIVTHEAGCNVLHTWTAGSPPTMGAAVVAPHLDPPIGGYEEFGFFENKQQGPSDDEPYYWDENPNPGSDFQWFMDPSRKLNPGGDLSSPSAGGNQTASLTADLFDSPTEPCLNDKSNPNYKPGEYMGFSTTLVGVNSGLDVTPSKHSVPLASFVWYSNFDGTAGAVTPGSPRPWSWPGATVNDGSGTGGVFNMSQVDVNSLPLAVRQTLFNAGVQHISLADDTGDATLSTAAILSGTQGLNGWFTSPVQVTLFATDLGGPDNVATTNYSLDGGSATSYAGPFTVTGEGTHSISFGSVSQAGYAETPEKTQAIKIDQTPPASRVAPLPATSSGSFTVQWSGSDAISGVQDYTIYVSDNGGPFTAWQANTTATTATYAGQNGHNYGFYSVATDLAGNVEAAKTTAEATTTVSGVVNVTSGVKVTGTGFLYSRTTRTYNGTITVTNIGSSAIQGPLQIGFGGLPTGVTLANATTTNGGVPYVTLASGLAAGKSASFAVQFSNPSNVSINYSPIVYSGAF